MCICFLVLSRMIKNKEALSEIMQDFKYDSEESDWQVTPRSPAAALVIAQWGWQVNSPLLQLPSWTSRLQL